MPRKGNESQRRILTQEEDAAFFTPHALVSLRESVDIMGPYEPDASSLSPEQEAKLNSFVEGYCASGHDRDYLAHAEIKNY